MEEQEPADESAADVASPVTYNFGPAAGLPDVVSSTGAARIRPRAKAVRVADPGRLLGIALALGVAADTLVYGQSPGLGVFLFSVLLVGGLIAAGRHEPVRLRLRNVVPLATAFLFLAAMTAVHTSGLLTFCNIVVGLGLAALLAQLCVAGDLATSRAGEFLAAPFRVLGHMLTGAAPLARSSMEARSSDEERSARRRRFMPFVRGVLLTLPVVAVFIALLSSADALFARGVEQIGRWLLPSDMAERLWRGFLVLCCAWLTAGGLAFALTRRDRETRSAGNVDPATTGRLGFTESSMVLGSVCAVFAAFVAIQFAYFFGGGDLVRHVPGLTYKEYVHRGFAELVWTAVLTLTLILSLRAVTRRTTDIQHFAFNSLGTLLVTLTLIVLFSASRRMSAYEEAYGATILRLYVDTFIFWLGVTLVCFALTLWARRGVAGRIFPAAALACGVGFLATMNLHNPEAAIVRANLDRYQKIGKLDFGYLAQCDSDDAILELCRVLKMTRGDEQSRIAARLRLRLTESEMERGTAGWPSWNLARERAYAALKDVEPSLPTQKAAEACLNRNSE